MTETYRIGPYLLDAETGVLTEGGNPVALGKRAVAVLSVLVRSASAFVPKARILEAAWPGVVVEEGNLAVQIASIRRELRRVPGGERWLETLAGRGYRFVGPVTPVAASDADGRGGAARTNLPEPLTSFVGRERELAELRAMLAKDRLVTLTGTGGVGKTRLAMRVAADALDDYRDGAWLVELAALREPDLVAQSAVAALGLKEQPGRSLVETLAGSLHDRRLLLVLDNAEHLLAACAGLADTLLRHCPGVTLLVTSREPLGVPGERAYRVPSLSMPDPQRDASAGSLSATESARLFAYRVRLHSPHFAITDRNAAAIASLCRRLDGIALAIELAAARTRSMSVDEVSRRLDQRLSLLTGGARTVPRRQQTLRAAIDWSYDLLSDAEKAILGRLSVFAGGWTLDAAERVCGDDGIATRDVIDLLASLVDRSLVVAEERAAGTRYRLLESLEQYAAERLRERADEVRWQERHLEHFRALAEEAEPQLTGRDQQAWLERLDAEHDNVRAALARAAAGVGGGEAGLRLASAVARFWLVRGYLTEGRGWLSRLLAAAPDAAPVARARALNWAGILAWKQGDYRAAQSCYEQCLAIRRELGDRPGVGVVLSNQGLLAYERGDYAAARALHEQSLAIDRELGDRWGVAVSLLHLGSLAMMQGDYPAARASCNESLAIFRELGDRGHVANAIRSLANLRIQEGDPASARTLCEESAAICRELGDRSGLAWALLGLGSAARHQDDATAARSLLEDALAAFRDLGDREGVAAALGELGRVAAEGNDAGSARPLAAESLALYRDLGDRSGIAATIDTLAAIASAQGDAGRAARLWGAAERLREAIGTPRPPGERARHDRNVAAARAALGAAAFDRAWQAGRAMAFDEAIAGALDERE